MKIGIIGAMEQEIIILQAQMENLAQTTEAGCIFLSGKLNDVDVVILQSGIGKVSAALGTALLISNHQVEIVINTGSAGAFNSSLNLGDIVISTEVRHHDADVTAFGYEIGQMAQQPIGFHADEKLIELSEIAFEQLKIEHTLTKGLICSGDAFIHTLEQRNFIQVNFPSVIAVEMEAAAIAQTCYQFNIPFVVIRAISDIADKASPMTFEEFLPLAAQNSSSMVLEMIALLKN